MTRDGIDDQAAELRLSSSFPDDEETKPELKSPLPPKRDTMSPADAERLMVRKALEASAAATEALTAILPTLATKDDVAAINKRLGELSARVGGLDAGVGAMGDELATIDADIRRGFADTKLWLFGDEHQRGIVKDLELAREGIGSALAAATKAGQEIAIVKKLTVTIFDGVINGPETIGVKEREAVEAHR